MTHIAIVRKAHQGEVNFIWADLTHVLKDMSTGELFAVTKVALEGENLCEGDIVKYRKKDNEGNRFTLIIEEIILPFCGN